jgi:hypothetical protein
MNHPLRRRPTRDRIIAMEVMKLELHRDRPRVAGTRRGEPVSAQPATAAELRRAA